VNLTCSVNIYKVQIYIITGFEDKSGHMVSVIVLDHIVLRYIDSSLVLWQPLVTNTNSIQEVNILVGYYCRDHKRTRQEVFNVLLSYLYYRYIVYVNNKQPYPNVHVLFMLPLYINLMSSIRILCLIYIP